MKYVYGIVPTPQAPHPNPELVGLHGAPLQVVAHNGLTAVISEAIPYDYESLPKPELVKILAQHQQATERIMQLSATLLPVKFGTLLQPQDVPQLLRQASLDLTSALEKVASHVEVEVVAMWEPQRVFAEIAQDPAVAAMRAEAAGKSPDEVQQVQIRLGVYVMQQMEVRRANYLERIRTALAELADDVEANAIVNDQVVANLAFLLPVGKQAEFDRQVEALDKELGGDLFFKVVGPLPAYSFSTVEVQQVWPDDVSWAQTRLGITGAVTGGEIRAAYLREARLHHPDAHPGDAEALGEFRDVTRAYQLLRSLHAMQLRSAAPQATEPSYRCDVAASAAAGMLLVNICRSSDLAARREHT